MRKRGREWMDVSRRNLARIEEQSWSRNRRIRNDVARNLIPWGNLSWERWIAQRVIDPMLSNVTYAKEITLLSSRQFYYFQNVRKLCFYNSEVKRGGRESSYPVNRNTSIINSIEKNRLFFLSRAPGARLAFHILRTDRNQSNQYLESIRLTMRRNNKSLGEPQQEENENSKEKRRIIALNNRPILLRDEETCG